VGVAVEPEVSEGSIVINEASSGLAVVIVKRHAGLDAGVYSWLVKMQCKTQCIVFFSMYSSRHHVVTRYVCRSSVPIPSRKGCSRALLDATVREDLGLSQS